MIKTMSVVHHKDGDVTNNDRANLEVLLLHEPRHVIIKSRIHDEDVAGVFMTDNAIQFVKKITIKPKIDWLKINQECSE